MRAFVSAIAGVLACLPIWLSPIHAGQLDIRTAPPETLQYFLSHHSDWLPFDPPVTDNPFADKRKFEEMRRDWAARVTDVFGPPTDLSQWVLMSKGQRVHLIPKYNDSLKSMLVCIWPGRVVNSPKGPVGFWLNENNSIGARCGETDGLAAFQVNFENDEDAEFFFNKTYGEHAYMDIYSDNCQAFRDPYGHDVMVCRIKAAVLEDPDGIFGQIDFRSYIPPYGSTTALAHVFRHASNPDLSALGQSNLRVTPGGQTTPRGLLDTSNFDNGG